MIYYIILCMVKHAFILRPIVGTVGMEIAIMTTQTSHSAVD